VRTVVIGWLACPVARCLRNLGSMKGVACLGQRHSADTLHSEHRFPGSPDFPIVQTKTALPRFGHAPLCSQLDGFGSSRWVAKQVGRFPNRSRRSSNSASTWRVSSSGPTSRSIEVDPPVQVEIARWSKAGQLDWWVKECQQWLGRVRGADDRRRWIRASDLRPVSGSQMT
jgi:hypothetical protein